MLLVPLSEVSFEEKFIFCEIAKDETLSKHSKLNLVCLFEPQLVNDTILIYSRLLGSMLTCRNLGNQCFFDATLLPTTWIAGEKIARNFVLARQVVCLQKVKELSIFESILTFLLALIKGLISSLSLAYLVTLMSY